MDVWSRKGQTKHSLYCWLWLTSLVYNDIRLMLRCHIPPDLCMICEAYVSVMKMNTIVLAFLYIMIFIWCCCAIFLPVLCLIYVKRMYQLWKSNIIFLTFLTTLRVVCYVQSYSLDILIHLLRFSPVCFYFFVFCFQGNCRCINESYNHKLK